MKRTKDYTVIYLLFLALFFTSYPVILLVKMQFADATWQQPVKYLPITTNLSQKGVFVDTVFTIKKPYKYGFNINYLEDSGSLAGTEKLLNLIDGSYRNNIGQENISRAVPLKLNIKVFNQGDTGFVLIKNEDVVGTRNVGRTADYLDGEIVKYDLTEGVYRVIIESTQNAPEYSDIKASFSVYGYQPK